MSTAIHVEPPAVRFQTGEPGIYPDVSEADYHRDCVIGGSLSSTGARTLTTKTPAHFQHQRLHGRPDRSYFDLGRAAHTAVLGRGSDLAVIDAPDYRTKGAREERDEARLLGLTPLLRHEHDQVQAMADAVRNHPVAGPLFARTDGQPEVTIIARDPETGVMCRVRIDLLLPGAAVDLKTGQDSSPAGMAKSMSSYGYDQQGDFYTWAEALAADRDEPLPFVLVHVEKEPPHLVGIGQPDEQALAWGRTRNRKARDLYRRCTETGQWPGHQTEPAPLSLPGWQLNQLEQQYDLGAFDIAPRPDIDVPAQGGTP